jgi:hypothetical protein
MLDKNTEAFKKIYGKKKLIKIFGKKN